MQQNFFSKDKVQLTDEDELTSQQNAGQQQISGPDETPIGGINMRREQPKLI